MRPLSTHSGSSARYKADDYGPVQRRAAQRIVRYSRMLGATRFLTRDGTRTVGDDLVATHPSTKLPYQDVRASCHHGAESRENWVARS
jgi:hypothetical protein